MTRDMGMRDAVDTAIRTTVTERERGVVTKWVALIESVGPDGERGLWTLASSDNKGWDTCGMLQYGLHMEAAREVDDRLNGDE